MVSGENSFPGLQTAALLLGSHMAIRLCMSLEQERPHMSLPLAIRAPALLDEGPIFMTSFNIRYCPLRPHLQVQSHSEVLGVRTSADELGRHSSAHDTDLWLPPSYSFHPCLCISAPSLASCFHCLFPSLPPHPEAWRSLVITTAGQSAPLSAPGCRTGRQAWPRAGFLLGCVAPTLKWATGIWAYRAFLVHPFSRILSERPTPAPFFSNLPAPTLRVSC